MQHKNPFTVIPVEDTTGRFNDLAVAGSLELSRAAATLGVICQLPDVRQNTPDQLRGRGVILQRDVVGNRVEVA